MDVSTVQEQDSNTFTCGDWCIAKYDGKCYPGIIEKIVNAEFQVSVMVPCGQSKWKWPVPVDCVWYTRDSIIKKIDPPQLVTARGHFQFRGVQDNEL